MTPKVTSSEDLAKLIPQGYFTTTELFNSINLNASRSALDSRLKYLSKCKLIKFNNDYPRLWWLIVDRETLIQKCIEIDKKRGALVANDQRSEWRKK
ncbi:MAG TPA: hypothetical protein VIC51_06115 [Psychromonas sp.]